MTWRCKSSRHTWMNGTQRSDDQQQTHMRELAGHQCSSAMLQLPGTQLQCCEPAMASRLYITNIDHAPQVEMLVMHIHCAACTTGRLYKTMPARQCYLLIHCLQNNKLWLNRAHMLRYSDTALHLSMLMQARQACMQHCSTKSSRSSLKNASASSCRSSHPVRGGTSWHSTSLKTACKGP